jgi:hypothetical protein
VRIVAGAGGWGQAVVARHYHNDAGVKARTVADDAARTGGETIGTFVPVSERVGIDYVRQAGPASRTLENVLGGAPWWVGYDGVTHAGPRPASPVDSAGYEVLAYNPRERRLELAVTDPRNVGIGSIVSERLDAPQTVREFELTVSAGDLRIVAWTGGSEAGAGLAPGLLRSIVARMVDGRLYGKFRYRVLRMAGDRVELQAVRNSAGLPDVLPVSMWPGVAGVHAVLVPGSECLVEFIEGDRALPIVTHFAGKDGVGFEPAELVLGGAVGSPVARQGDAIEGLLPPAVFTGTITLPSGPSPATGVLTFVTQKFLGVITAGSAKVKSA